MTLTTRTCLPFAVPALLLLAASTALAQTPAYYGCMFRTAGQTAGVGPKLYDVDVATGAATNPRTVNVNDCVGIAIDPFSRVMYGMTDQLGRINNTPGTGGKNLLFTIDRATGLATAVGQTDPADTSGPKAMFEGDIAFDHDGVLYAVSTHITSATLMRIDTSTGAASIVGTIEPPDIVPVDPGSGQRLFDISAMAISSTNDMYVLDTTFPTTPGAARIYRINPANGAVLQAFQTTVALGNCAGMMYNAAGELLVADGDTSGTGNLYRFTGGDLALIGPTGASGGTTVVYVGLAGLAADLGTRPVCGSADFDGDGDTGTDQDIEAFFRCLSGDCCATCFAGGADFNGDGDTGTDQDIEAFFRVLAGGEC